MKFNKKKLNKVCDDAPLNGGIKNSEWRYDPDSDAYYRFQDDIPVRKIKRKYIPNPAKIEQERQKTLDTIAKYVSAEKIEKVAGKAIKKGRDPEKAVLEAIRVRPNASEAVHSLWQHRRSLDA